MDEILQYKHSNENYSTVLSCYAVYDTVQGGCESVNKTIVVQANERLLPVVQSKPVNTDTGGAIYTTCLY